MSEAVKTSEPGPLRLDAAWRINDRKSGAATVHPLRIVPGAERRGPVEREELKAIVAEIVREELRSDLGRQMTGSIRRLVRDEVAKIFTRLGTR